MEEPEPPRDESLTKLPQTLPGSLQHLDPIAVIGWGAYAQVLEVRDTLNGEPRALKIVEKEPLAVRGMLRQLALELGVQRSINHPHVVAAVDIAEDHTHTYMVTDLCVGGSVWQATLYFPDGIVPEPLAARWLRGATEGVAHLHRLGIVHRDVKLENLLLDDRGFVRLCDFGWCAFEADQPRGLCGTPQLVPPEVKRGESQTSKMDTWALGACLVQLLTGSPINGPEDAKLPAGPSAAAQDLSVALLDHNPSTRITAEAALRRPFLEEAFGGSAPSVGPSDAQGKESLGRTADVWSQDYLLQGALDAAAKIARGCQQQMGLGVIASKRTTAAAEAPTTSVFGSTSAVRAAHTCGEALLHASVARAAACESQVLAAKVVNQVDALRQACREAAEDRRRRRQPWQQQPSD